ncbi:MAG TPA: metalloprotease PmbA, partial [Gammaproteobacteria bacterium]|nr:metalloprotease PmbA [Gammaproteobacteria bacterium]
MNKNLQSQRDVNFNVDQWQNLAIDVLREAEILGASSAELEISAGKGFTVNSRLGEVETVEYHQGKSIDITVFFGK